MPKHNPLISVVMSVYKEPIDWLCKSIDSIINQTYQHFEFIIVCDNPLYEEGKSLLKEYSKRDDRIVLIFNEENIGLTKSLNKGLSIARGEYIARMDADDISLNNRFEVEVEYLTKNPQVDVCGSNARLFGKNILLPSTKNYPISSEDICDCMIFENPIAHPSVMMKRVIKGEVVKYNETAKKAQDYVLWNDLSIKGASFYNFQKPLIKYRISSSQISSGDDSIQKSVGNHLRRLLLKKMDPQLADKDILTHNEICNSVKSCIGLNEKISWLCKLFDIINKSEGHHKYAEKLIFFYFYKTCFLYNDTSAFKNKYNFKCNYWNLHFITSYVRYLFNKL